MSKLTYYSKAVWLSLIFIVAVMSINASSAVAQEIQWHQDLAEAKAQARDTNRLVWLHFTADWCVPCKRLDSFVFSSTAVSRAAARNTVAVKIDADLHESLVKQLDVPRIPYDVVMTPSGRVILNRSSPQDTAGFLKIFNGLDRPLQELTSGDREVINARIDKLHGIIKRSGGLRQKKSDLDLEGPSHEMASTTVEGQRLERGFESSQRASEIRAVKAKLLKQKAEVYIAEHEQRKKGGQRPKFSDNPFFNPANDSGKSAQPTNNPLSDNGGQALTSGVSRTMTNEFVRQDSPLQSTKDGSDFVPPMPPTFGNKAVEKVAIEAGPDLTPYDERQEFSFASTKPSDTAQEAGAKPFLGLAAPKLTLPKFAEPKLPLPQLSKFKDRSGEKANSNEFAYAPIDKLRNVLRSESRTSVPQAAPSALKSFDNPVNDSTPDNLTAKTPKLSLSTSQPSAFAVKPTPVQQRPAFRAPVDAFAEYKPPAMKTDISIPQAPVMVEGVVQIAQAVVPAVEGRLIAAEQSLDAGSWVRNDQSQVISQKQVSRTDRLLENVNFFAPDTKPAQPAPRTIAAPGQPVPQSQIVINLNTGNTVAPQPPQSVNQATIIQPNLVAQASSSSAVASRARISNADIASAVRSKYALKGKCPVTLLSNGRWVDGKKEIGCVHRDRVYLFATAAHREAFLADPDRLSPLLAGFDPVVFEETGKLIEGDEKFGTFMGNKPNQRIVLFKTADTRERFQKEPSKYLEVVRRAMTGNAPKDIKLR